MSINDRIRNLLDMYFRCNTRVDDDVDEWQTRAAIARKIELHRELEYENTKETWTPLEIFQYHKQYRWSQTKEMATHMGLPNAFYLSQDMACRAVLLAMGNSPPIVPRHHNFLWNMELVKNSPFIQADCCKIK
jgi:hypothetical protein